MTTGYIAPAGLQAFPTFNGLAPKQGPKALPVKLDFTTNDRIEFDLEQVEELNIISFVQMLFADNSDNPNALVMRVDQTGQRLVIPAYAQGHWPVIACKAPKFVFTTTAGVICNIILQNVPMPETQWGPISVSASLVTSGQFTDRSNVGTGASVQIAAANALRKGFLINAFAANADPVYVNFGAAATNGGNSFQILPGGSFGGYLGPVSTQTVNVLATLADKFVAKEL